MISEYGAGSPTEFVAEAFDLYNSPRYTKGSLPRELEELLEKMMQTGRL
jgi:hypothetical protein